MGTQHPEALYLNCSRTSSIITWVGFWLNAALVTWSFRWLALYCRETEIGYIGFLIAIFVGLFLADFLSGLVHWTTDTWFDEIMLERLVSITREHHIYPHHITGYGLRDYLGYSSWPTVVLIGPVLFTLTLFCAVTDLVYLAVFVFTEISFCMIFGTYAHRLGHVRAKSPIIRFLQRTRFLISPAYHQHHHRGDHGIRYCVINGWANEVCDRIRFWRALERLVRTLTGAVPHKNDREWFARYAEDPSFMRNPIPSLIALRYHASEISYKIGEVENRS